MPEPKSRSAECRRAISNREKKINETVGWNIRALRTMTGISQMELAESLGVSFQQVQKYEKGVNRVSAAKLVLMAEIFKQPLDILFSNTGAVPQDRALPALGKDAMRAARLINALSPKKQDAALDVLRTLAKVDGVS